MSQGKYSPSLPKDHGKKVEFIYNCYGEIPPTDWTPETYDTKIHFGDYDTEGFDRYGYSAFEDGKYVGIGDGVDRFGNTEMEYLASDDLYEDARGGYCNIVPLKTDRN